MKVLSMSAGEKLKEFRNRLGISMREVEETSRRIAETEGNNEYIISSGWLTQIENSNSTPSIYKLFTVSIIYRIKFPDLLFMYGIDLERIGRLQLANPLANTHITQLEVYDQDRTVQFPVRFDSSFSIEKTSLIARMVEMWGELPMGIIQSLDIRKFLYGYIGTKDTTLFPLLRPGSFVQIDNRQNRVEKPPWKTEFDRPIYFVELRDKYLCSWCELHGKQLFVVPHPLSGCTISQYSYPDEAEIVGRVTGVAMRIATSVSDPSTDARQIPKPS